MFFSVQIKQTQKFACGFARDNLHVFQKDAGYRTGLSLIGKLYANYMQIGCIDIKVSAGYGDLYFSCFSIPFTSPLTSARSISSNLLSEGISSWTCGRIDS